MTKPKVFFLFGSQASIRTFSEYSILDDLQSYGDLDITCILRAHTKYRRVDPVYETSNFPVINIRGEDSSFSRFQNWLQVSMQIHKRQSIAFVEKTRRITLGNLTRKGFGRSWLHYIAYLASNVIRFRTIFTLLGCVPFLNIAIAELLWKLVPENKELKFLLEFEKPDLVIVVSTGQEPLLAEVQKIRSAKNSWVFLPDNWDNIFTKCLFKHQPQAYWVWSQQQKFFLISNRKIPSNKIHLLGSSRMRSNRFLANQKKSSNVNQSTKFKIAYLGQEAPHNEVQDLAILLMCCEWAKERFNKDFEVHYRPHPTARPRSRRSMDSSQTFLLEELLGHANLVLHRIDSPSPLRILENESNYVFLNSMDIVIGAPTTMLLEAVALGIPTGVFVSDDQMHRSSSFRQWKFMPHFNGLEGIHNLFVISNEFDIRSLVEQVINDANTNLRERDILVEYYTGPLDDRYTEKLRELIKFYVKNLD